MAGLYVAPGRVLDAAALAGRIREAVKIRSVVEVIPSGTLPDDLRPPVDAREELTGGSG